MPRRNELTNNTQNDVTQYDQDFESVSDNDITRTPIRRLCLRDNLDAMRELEDGAVDLVYLDPPFNTNRTYKIVFRGPESLRPDAHLPAFEERNISTTFPRDKMPMLAGTGSHRRK